MNRDFASMSIQAIPQGDGDSRPLVIQRHRFGAVALTGLAVMLSKARGIHNNEQDLRIWPAHSPEEQENLLLDARRAANEQNPSIRRRAHDLALERAEQVIAEEGAIATPQARHLARRIAAEAMLTYRLALEGSLDTPTSTGGVQ